jgi:putative colanic acid biosynthesis UDP-glucose lipid carrier transferase
MLANKKSIYYIRLLSDLILLNISFIAAAVLAQSLKTLLLKNHMFVLEAGVNFIWLYFANVINFYDESNDRSLSLQTVNIIKSLVTQGLTVIIFIFLFKENLFTRNFIIIYLILLGLLVWMRILIFRMIFRSLRKSGKGIKNLLIIGTGEVGQNFSNIIENNPGYGYNFVGFLDEKNIPFEGPHILGGINDLEDILLKYKIEEVVIAIPDYAASLLNGIIRTCNRHAVMTHIIPDYFKFISKRFKISLIGNFPVISVRNEPLEEFHWKFLKRSFDIVFSLLFLILIYVWLFPIIAFLLRRDSKGPVIFVQERIGVKNKKFRCYKFRTLTAVTGKEHFVPVMMNDPRITKFGNLLRRSNLDEIPQFVNVLKGEMSVVGPRPHAIPYDNKYGLIVDEIKLRHNVKPGITGWAQVHGLRGDSFSEEENTRRTIKRIEHDIWYIENWSFWLDLQIIFLTVWQMIKGDTKGF